MNMGQGSNGNDCPFYLIPSNKAHPSAPSTDDRIELDMNTCNRHMILHLQRVLGCVNPLPIYALRVFPKERDDGHC